MSNLPFNLSSSHYSAEDIYDLYRGTSASRWDSMSDGTRAKWEYLASWINERTPHNVDVTALVDEMLRRGKVRIPFITPADDSADLENVGMDVHDDDIVAAAQRFLKEHNAQQEDASTVRQSTDGYAVEEGDTLVDILKRAETMQPDVAEDKPVKPSAVEVIDALAEMLKRLLG